MQKNSRGSHIAFTYIMKVIDIIQLTMDNFQASHTKFYTLPAENISLSRSDLGPAEIKLSASW